MRVVGVTAKEVIAVDMNAKGAKAKIASVVNARDLIAGDALARIATRASAERGAIVESFRSMLQWPRRWTGNENKQRRIRA